MRFRLEGFEFGTFLARTGFYCGNPDNLFPLPRGKDVGWIVEAVDNIFALIGYLFLSGFVGLIGGDSAIGFAGCFALSPLVVTLVLFVSQQRYVDE